MGGLEKEDRPANRVKPIPISVNRKISFIAQHFPSGPVGDRLRTAVDMIIIAFFYLLRPGPTPLRTPPNSRLGVYQLSLGDMRLDVLTTTEATLFHARSSSLTFTTQKNGFPAEGGAVQAAKWEMG